VSRSVKQPYPQKHTSKRWDKHCRNHGRCGWCERQRTFGSTRREPLVLAEEVDYARKSGAEPA
jgi:hypothetical protein